MGLDETDSLSALGSGSWYQAYWDMEDITLRLSDQQAGLTEQLEARRRPKIDSTRSFHWRSAVWNVSSPQEGWQTIDASDARKIEAAGGVVDEFFAFCQTMPIESYLAVNRALRPYKHRPIRVGPYTVRDEVLVACLWTRDQGAGDVSIGLTAPELQARLDKRSATHLVLDISAYKSDQMRFAVTWQTRTEQDVPQVVYFGASDAQQRKSKLRLYQEGFIQTSGASSKHPQASGGTP